MKLRLRTAILIFGCLLMLPLQAVAQGDRTQTTEEPSAQPIRVRATAADKQRIEARKERIQVRLSAARKRRLEQRCSAAQVKLQTAATRADTVQAHREEMYTKLTNRLDAFALRLKNHNLDSQPLEDATEELAGKIQDFFSHLESYQTALNDAIIMDCESDPEAFQAALKDARNQRIALRKEAKSIRTFVRQTLKDTFTAIRKELKSDEQSSSDSTSQNSSGGSD